MYDSDTSTVTTALKGSSTAVFTDDTISKILALTTTDNATVRFDTAAPDANGNVTVAAGAEVVLISSSDTTQTTLTPPASAPVLIFQGKGGVDVTINDGSTTPAHQPGVTDRVVIGSAGNDKIVVTDAKNTQIVLGSGDSTVIGGAGSDTIVAGLGNSTVTGGKHDIVQLKGDASDYVVTVDNGHAVVTHAGTDKVTDISKIQYVQLDSGKALVFANDTEQAAITTLYETAFGRTADAGGLQYWFDRAAAGDSLDKIASDFTKTTEFTAANGQLDNDDFIQALYQKTFGRTAEDDGLAYWTAALETGGATRAQLIKSFADIAAANIDGSVHTEATVVGSVTIVHNIV
jgi:Ca2+-binding RTX toxin-like protein